MTGPATRDAIWVSQALGRLLTRFEDAIRLNERDPRRSIGLEGVSALREEIQDAVKGRLFDARSRG